MSTGDWSVVAAYFVVVVLLGSGVIRLLRPPPCHLLRDWSACYLAGQIVLLILTLGTGLLPCTHRQLLPVVLVFAGVVGVIGLVRAGRRAAVVVAATAGFLLLVLVLFPNVAMVVHRSPVVETDARSIWMFHGKALFTASGIDPAFFTDPIYWWSSPDYPLLLPAQAAWSSLGLGRWSDVASRAFLWFHFAAWFRLLYLVLRARGYPWVLALALTGAFLLQGTNVVTPGFPYVSGQADCHYVVPLVLAMLVLGQRGAASGGGNPGTTGSSVGLVVLLLAYAASTKSEGTVYAALFAGTWLVWQGLVRVRAAGLRGLAAATRSAGRAWLFAAVLGLLPVVLWAVFKTRHDMGSSLRVFERLTTPGLFADLLSVRLGTVLRCVRDDLQMQDTYRLWLVLAALVGASFVCQRLGRRPAGIRLIEVGTAGVWLVVMALTVTIYVLTPHDYVFHMESSVTRLLLLPHLIVFVLVVLRIDALWAAVTSRPGLPALPGSPAATG